MSESMPATTAAPKKAQRQPWDKAPEENDLWYARFVRFVALGPGRSVSLLTRGRRNAYPVPAHWPIQAKQWQWRERAKAFDDAAKASPTLINEFNVLLVALRQSAPNGEAVKFEGLAYQAPTAEDYDDNEADSLSATN